MDNILYGFEIAFTFQNVVFVLLGVLVGTATGVLPGLGSTATVALLLPLTYAMEPAGAIIFLAGIFYGAMFGGRIPAILMNLPGDSAAVVTTFDGYPLRQQGKAGQALGLTAIASFVGGTISVIGITLFAPLASQWALRIGSAELFLMAFIGLLMIALLNDGSVIKGLISAAAGIAIASIGLDVFTGSQRMTFGVDELQDGIGIVPLVVGIFGVGELIIDAESRFARGHLGKLERLWPRVNDIVSTRWAVLRASVLGFFLGLIPGGGGSMASVVAYGAEKKFSKRPERFGKGAMDGLAATETADNAASNSSFVPLLTLGIPPNSTIALIAGALTIQGVTPGPQLVEQNPDIFWGLIASMYIGLVALIILNLPLIGIFVQILKIPAPVLVCIIFSAAVFGVYTVRNSIFDVILMLGFGLVGYALKKVKMPMGPMILGVILAPVMEEELRRTLQISQGSFSVFMERPISLTLIVLIAVIVFSSALPWKRWVRAVVRPAEAGHRTEEIEENQSSEKG